MVFCTPGQEEARHTALKALQALAERCWSASSHGSGDRGGIAMKGCIQSLQIILSNQAERSAVRLQACRTLHALMRQQGHMEGFM
jgi:hypothetical protein